MSEGKILVSLQNIIDAQKVIKDHVHKTPLIHSTNFIKNINTNLYFKTEVFQKIGSFKLRGILNKFHNLTKEEKELGVITASAGNHGQSLAFAASELGIQAVVVMPAYASKHKIKSIKAFGAEVILNDKSSSLLEKLLKVKEEQNLTLIHPFDDLDIIAGHGTIGLEILRDLTEIPDLVVVPVGGGGLISGIATSIKSKYPDVKVIGVEPLGAAVMNKSLLTNTIATLDEVNTIADGLAAPFAGKYTLAHIKEFVNDIVLVSDDEIMQALRLLLVQGKILTEPAGAAGFAALLNKKIEVNKEDNVVCVLSGGNIDTELLKTIISIQ
jgi:threonine dehydratase